MLFTFDSVANLPFASRSVLPGEGTFRAGLDVENFYYTITAIVAQYFNNSSAIFEISGSDPLSPERVQARRAAVLDVITASLLAQKNES